MLLCDNPRCNKGYHINCLHPPLASVPRGAWFCPECKAEAPICGTCGEPALSRLGPLKCVSCEQFFHRECMGLHRHSFIAGEFVCAPCVLLAAKISSASSKATEAANTLVYLRANRVQGSSLDTYAASLHRFVHFATSVAGYSVEEALPPGKNGVIPPALVELFLADATNKYKHSTIKATLVSLAHWHKSKGAPVDSVHNPSTFDLLRAIARHQGPQGVPQGKAGMSKSLLRLLLSHLATKAQGDPRMAPIHMRDQAWLVLGFFGMMRRSEILALRVGDISYSPSPAPHLSVRIARSKTDPEGKGSNVIIRAVSKDSIKIWDRVHALLQYRTAQGAAPQDPLFTQWDLDKMQLSAIPLGTGQALAKRLQVMLSALVTQYPSLPVHPASYGMHSLRRGGATAAWEGGVDRDRIMSHGRWTSAAVDAYLVATPVIKLSVTALM